MKNFTNAEELNRRTLEAQEKIKAGGKDALDAHFELNKLAEEAENVREEAEQENAQFNEKKKLKKEGEKDLEIVLNSENKENAIEDKTLGPIYMVYRDNRNWEKYAPKIIDHIRKELGGQVEVQVFSRETDKKEIKKWYQENEAKFKDELILSDDTCDPPFEADSVDFLGRVTKKIDEKDKKFKNKFNLDSYLWQLNREIAEKMLEKTFGTRNITALMDTYEETKDVYTRIFKLALEKNNPRKIVFVEFRFGHHINVVNPIEANKRSEKNDQEVLEFVKKCLLDAGYPEANISIVSDVEKITDPEKIKSVEDEWFFIDSHNPMQYVYADDGLKVFDPTKIYGTIGVSEDNFTTEALISKIDQNIRKIDTPEDFVSIFTSNPNFSNLNQGQKEEVYKKIGSEEKFIKIVNYLIDLHKNDPLWKGNNFKTVVDMIFWSRRCGLPLSKGGEEQINKRIEEVMASS